jgi:hypothetical protein
VARSSSSSFIKKLDQDNKNATLCGVERTEFDRGQVLPKDSKTRNLLKDAKPIRRYTTRSYPTARELELGDLAARGSEGSLFETLAERDNSDDFVYA